MPRPVKWRRVCCMPDNSRYGPLDKQIDERNVVFMSVDEYEAIRLIDAEGCTQEECAEQMNVSRSTVQSIYDSARKKLAASLIDGSMLRIEGGEFRLCDGVSRWCGSRCQKHHHGRRCSFNPEYELQTKKIETEKNDENSNTDE